MKKDDYLKGIITLQSIIVAGLFVWAQLWTSTYNNYDPYGYHVWEVNLTLAAIYFAALSSILSIIFAIYTLIVPSTVRARRLAISFSCFSFIILFLLILASAISVYLRALSGYGWELLFSDKSKLYITIAGPIFGLVVFVIVYKLLEPWISSIILFKSRRINTKQIRRLRRISHRILMKSNRRSRFQRIIEFWQ